MKVVNIGSTNSVLNKFISQMRDKNIQKDAMRFRLNLNRVGQIFGYEISKTLNYEENQVTTPLGIASVPAISDKVVLATILRAGLPLHEGLLNYFDDAQNAFIAAYRKYDKGGEFKVEVEYCTSPDINGKVLILADTMLATGISLEKAYRRILENGTPSYTHLVCPIASEYAVEALKKSLHGENVTLWTATVDEELTSHYYIVPGLGDAGDLAFGDKL